MVRNRHTWRLNPGMKCRLFYGHTWIAWKNGGPNSIRPYIEDDTNSIHLAKRSKLTDPRHPRVRCVKQQEAGPPRRHLPNLILDAQHVVRSMGHWRRRMCSSVCVSR